MNVRERREAQAWREARDLIDEIGPHRAAADLGVTLTTVKRWASGEVVPSTVTLIALRSVAVQHGPENKSWQGWRIAKDSIWSPAGEPFHPGDLLGLRYRIQLQKHLERQVSLLRDKLAKVQDGAANDAVDSEIRALSDQAMDFTIGRAKRA